MHFKRASDSHTYAILWWSASLLLHAWLVYYGYNKIKDIASREFFTQSKAFEMSSEQMFESFPDVMFCTGGGHVRLDSTHDDFMKQNVNYEYTEVKLAIKDVLDLSPCEDGDDTLTIFSMKNAPIDITGFSNQIYEICPRNFTVPGNFSTWWAAILLIPKQANPYTHAYGSLRLGDWPASLNLNTYITAQEGTRADINVEPRATKVIRNGIWGLFGSSEAKLEYSLRSSFSSISGISNCTIVAVNLSTVSQNDTQILVTSIPRAFADWGGAFSAAWAIFYFFFGAPRVDPFGVISRCFIGRKTKRYVTSFYGHWLSNPKEFTPVNPTIQHTFTTPRSSRNEKTTQDMHSTSSKGSSSTSSDIARLDAAAVAAREPQDEHRSEMQEEQIHKVEKLEANFNKLQADVQRLRGLLKEYYLEMDMTETETESLPQTGDRRWYRRFWPHKSSAGDGKSSPVTPPEDAAKEA